MSGNDEASASNSSGERTGIEHAAEHLAWQKIVLPRIMFLSPFTAKCCHLPTARCGTFSRQETGSLPGKSRYSGYGEILRAEIGYRKRARAEAQSPIKIIIALLARRELPAPRVRCPALALLALSAARLRHRRTSRSSGL